MSLDRGALVLLSLDPSLGDEQGRVRPCIVLRDAEVIWHHRFPLLAVVPVKGTHGHGPLYARLSPGSSGLVRPSFALIDQIHSVDRRRVRRIFGRIPREEIRTIDEGLKLFLGRDLTDDQIESW